MSVSIIRGIRADAIRGLVRQAVAQGFDVGVDGRGHLRLVSPSGGVARVSASSTSKDPHELKRARASLVAVGFHPDWSKRDARRAQRAELEVPRMREQMTIEDPPKRPAPLPEPSETPPRLAKHQPPEPGKGERHARYKTGRTMFVSDEIIVVAGTRFRLRARADGALVGWTPPDAPTWEDRKSFQVGPKTENQRDEIKRRMAEWVAAGKPPRARQGRETKTIPEESQPVSSNGIAADASSSPAASSAASSSATLARDVDPENQRAIDAYREIGSPVDRLAEAGKLPSVDDDSSVAWLTVRIDRSEYPLASSLAELVDKIAPAVQALEASGRKAAADLLVESVELSPAERELVALWQEVNGRPRLEHGRRDG